MSNHNLSCSILSKNAGDFPMGSLSMHGGGLWGILTRVGEQIAPYGA